MGLAMLGGCEGKGAQLVTAVLQQLAWLSSFSRGRTRRPQGSMPPRGPPGSPGLPSPPLPLLRPPPSSEPALDTAARRVEAATAAACSGAPPASAAAAACHRRRTRHLPRAHMLFKHPCMQDEPSRRRGNTATHLWLPAAAHAPAAHGRAAEAGRRAVWRSSCCPAAGAAHQRAGAASLRGPRLLVIPRLVDAPAGVQETK